MRWFGTDTLEKCYVEFEMSYSVSTAYRQSSSWAVHGRSCQLELSTAIFCCSRCFWSSLNYASIKFSSSYVSASVPFHCEHLLSPFSVVLLKSVVFSRQLRECAFSSLTYMYQIRAWLIDTAENRAFRVGPLSIRGRDIDYYWIPWSTDVVFNYRLPLDSLKYVRCFQLNFQKYVSWIF